MSQEINTTVIPSEVTTTTSYDDASEFQRFEDLAGRLLNVPKEESDAIHRDHQA